MSEILNVWKSSNSLNGTCFMNVTIASFKGGVGKTTTAIHLAAYFQGLGKTCLIDGDPNRSASAWAGRGTLPFDVIDEYQIMKVAQGGYKHLVFDTAARPDTNMLKTLIDGCDLLILPTRPETLSLDALVLTIAELKKMKTNKFRVLITMVPPKPAKDGEITRAAIENAGIPIFAGSIRSLKAFEKAATAGVVISEVADPRARFGWDDYEAIGKELV